jgi:DNA invertase Pin-like site-specific DNA recombinase
MARRKTIKTVVGYVRISDARGGDDAGVARQAKAISKLAADNGWTITRIYEDNSRSAFSGKTRPAFEEMLANLHGVDAVLVWRTDRLYRRLSDLERLVDELGDVPVIAVMSGRVDLATADGRLNARLLGSVAAHESEVKGERVTAAARQRAERGGYPGGPRRIGYSNDGMTLDPVEAPILSASYQSIINGASLRATARAATEAGLPISPAKLRSALLKPWAAGIVTYHGEEVGRHAGEVLVDESTWRAAVAILTDPRRRTTPGPQHRSLLTGIATCGKCGSPLRAATRHRRVNGVVRTYRCTARSTGGSCQGVNRRMDFLDELAEQAVVAWLTKNRAVLTKPKAAKKKDPRQAELARTLDTLVELDTMLEAGTIPVRDYGRVTTRLRVKADALTAELAAESTTPAAASVAAEKDTAKAFLALDVETRRTVIQELVESLVVQPQTRATNRPTAEGVELTWRKFG